MKYLIFATLLTSTACVQESVRLLSPGVQDGGGGTRDAGVLIPADTGFMARDVGVSDLRPVDTGPDSGVDAGIDPDAEPRRRLVEYKLLGDTPVENLVLNPRLDITASLGPGTFANNLQVYEKLGAPGNMPIAVSTNEPMLIPVQNVPDVKQFTVWVGERGREPSPQVFLLGLDSRYRETQVELPLTPELQEHDGVTYAKYQVSTIEPSRGLTFLAIIDGTYVTAPVAVQLDTLPGGIQLNRGHAMTAQGQALYRMAGAKIRDYNRSNIGLPQAEQNLRQGNLLKLRKGIQRLRRNRNVGPASVRRKR